MLFVIYNADNVINIVGSFNKTLTFFRWPLTFQ